MAGMMRNRSVPVDEVLPHVMYQDLPAAIAWLGNAFGFVEHYHYGEPMSGAQVWLGGAVVWYVPNSNFFVGGDVRMITVPGTAVGLYAMGGMHFGS